MPRFLLPSIVGLLVAVTPWVSHAEPAAISLDEQAFIGALTAGDPRAARQDAEVDAARAEVLAARVRPEPTIAVDREEVFPDGGLATNYARVTIPFEVSGRRGHRVTAARAEAEAAGADRDAARFVLLVDGLRTYYQAAYARLYREALARDREALVRAVETVRKRSTAGASAGYDLQRLELELAVYDDLTASAELDRIDAARDVAALIGRPDAVVEATSPLPLPAVPPPTAELVGKLAERPDYRAATLRADAARARGRAAARGWVPGLAVSAGLMGAEIGGETAFGYTAGVAITIPLFDRGQADRARASATERIAGADARWLERIVPARVVRARELLAGRIAQAETLATTRLARLDDLLRAAETAYREGDAGVVELLDAYRTARDTHLRDLELRRDAKLAELDLWLALGHRLGDTP